MDESSNEGPLTSWLVSRDDLISLNNALNEVCHGVKIPNGEFEARLGCSRAKMKRLLARVNRLIDEGFPDSNRIHN